MKWIRLKIRKWFEVYLIKLARVILRERNVLRSAVVSRRDNNEMIYISEKLEAIEDRMINEYQNKNPTGNS